MRSPSGRIQNSETFATLLLSDLWTAAQERGKRESGGLKPFYVYLDEFQRFVTPTIAENLDQARGFGLHFTLAHQFPLQLTDRGENGKRVYHSVMENASSKIVFRLSDQENLEPLAQWLFMGTWTPDKIKHEMYSTKVMEYREEIKETVTEGRASSRGGGTARGSAAGTGLGGTQVFPGDGLEVDPNSVSSSQSEFSATSQSDSETWSETETSSVSRTPTVVPVVGKELSHVQFESLEEQLFRSMAALFDQEQRQGVARVSGMKAPVSIRTPDVKSVPGSPENTNQYVDRLCAALPYAIPAERAREQVEARSAALPPDIVGTVEEPTTTGRRVARKG